MVVRAYRPAAPRRARPHRRRCSRRPRRRRHRGGVRGEGRGGGAAARLRARGRLRRGGRDVHRRRPVPVPADARRDGPAPRRRGPARGALRQARRARHRAPGRPGHRVRGLGAERALGLRRRGLQLVGRAAEPDAVARLERHLGAVPPRRRQRRQVQVRASHPGGRDPPQGRPGGVRDGAAAADRVAGLRVQARLERRGLDHAARRHEVPRRARLDLRGPPRLVAPEPARGQPLAHLPGAGRRAGGLRARHGLHAHRADAGDGAPVQRLVGLPGHGLLRPHTALRRARRLPCLRRPPAPAGARRDPRLGAGPLPARRLRARPVRRHRPLRARGSAPRLAPGLGHARLQLRPQRGAQLPPGQRAVLAARVPRRRHPRRRGRVDAVPRLLARGGPVGAQRVRRQRGPRGRRVPARSTTRSSTGASPA